MCHVPTAATETRKKRRWTIAGTIAAPIAASSASAGQGQNSSLVAVLTRARRDSPGAAMAAAIWCRTADHRAVQGAVRLVDGRPARPRTAVRHRSPFRGGNQPRRLEPARGSGPCGGGNERPSAWIDADAQHVGDVTPSLPSARCRACKVTRWWTERHEPKGWRCATCHPPDHLARGQVRWEPALEPSGPLL